MSASLTGLEWRSLGELSTFIRRGDVSPIELTRLLLDRIDTLDDRLGAYIEVYADDALATARAAESEIRQGQYRGPLHGIPIAVKDLFDVDGRHTSFGSGAFHDRVASADAAVVHRIRRAGAVILGKNNLHECAFGVTSENPHFGAVRNPWSTSRIAGGSSGGSAAAVAAGLCVAAIGSDTGGSIRIPAAYCGVVGFKPTFGTISRVGALPLADSLDHVGPLARTVADCAVMWDALIDSPPAAQPGPDQSRRAARTLSHLEGVRVGVARGEYFSDVDPAISRAVESAIVAMKEDGASVREIVIPHIAYAQAAGLTIMATEAAAWHGEMLRLRMANYGSDVRHRLQLGAVTLGTEYIAAQRIKAQVAMGFSEVFEAIDVVVSPTVSIPPPLIGHAFDAVAPSGVPARSLINRFTVPANLAGIPAISVPCGVVDDIPVGMQICGAANDDYMVLDVAQRWMDLCGWDAKPLSFYVSAHCS